MENITDRCSTCNQALHRTSSGLRHYVLCGTQRARVQAVEAADDQREAEGEWEAFAKAEADRLNQELGLPTWKRNVIAWNERS